MRILIVVEGHPEVSAFTDLMAAAARIDPAAVLRPGPADFAAGESDSYVVVDAGTIPEGGLAVEATWEIAHGEHTVTMGLPLAVGEEPA